MAGMVHDDRFDRSFCFVCPLHQKAGMLDGNRCVRIALNDKQRRAARGEVGHWAHLAIPLDFFSLVCLLRQNTGTKTIAKIRTIVVVEKFCTLEIGGAIPRYPTAHPILDPCQRRLTGEAFSRREDEHLGNLASGRITKGMKPRRIEPELHCVGCKITHRILGIDHAVSYHNTCVTIAEPIIHRDNAETVIQQLSCDKACRPNCNALLAASNPTTSMRVDDHGEWSGGIARWVVDIKEEVLMTSVLVKNISPLPART